MDTALYIIGGLAIGAAYFLYAGIIRKRNGVKESLSGIDVQLQKRSDLIPNVLAVAKKYMQHEAGIMIEITELRSKVAGNYNAQDPKEVQDHFAAAQQLGGKLGQFMLNVENYPDLKADSIMMEAMGSLNEVESQIAAARRFYNSAVTELNNSVQIFPGNIIANMIGIKEMPFYQADEAAKKSIDASKLLN